MRVALCLQGTVGNIYTNKKNYEYKEDVDFRIALEHYKKHLLDINNVDVFIHCWNKKYEESIIKNYSPKSYKFEDQIDFGMETQRLNFIKSRWYSQKEVLYLKQQYEKTHSFKYDYVMVSRLDLALLTDLKFSEYDPNMFWAPNDQENKNLSSITQMFLDYFFFSNSKNMDDFGLLYDNLDSIREWKKENLNKDLNAHEDSFLFTKMLNLSVDYLFKESKDHDLVRAIYENCEYNDDKFKGIESLKKYKEYPRHNGRF